MVAPMITHRDGAQAFSQLVPLTALLASIAIACTTAIPMPAPTTRPVPTATLAIATAAATKYGAECAAFAPDPGDAFGPPTAVSYGDETALDWPTATPDQVGLDAALLNRAGDNASLSSDIRSLLVVRHGKLVYERYFNGSDATDANNVWSLSKSILSVVTGIAIDRGLLSLGTRIDEFLPGDLVGAHGDLTVEHLLTMSGGLANSEDPHYLDGVEPSDLPGEPSLVRAVLRHPRVKPAGTEFAYSTGLTGVLAAVLTEATGTSLCAYSAEALLGPLGIDTESWWVEPDGYFAGGHSVFITPREVARFGQLVLDDGQWAGQQLVPSDWLELTLAEKWDLGCRPDRRAHLGYGHLWWLLDVDGQLAWQASGAGGQQLWIIPDLDAVMVVTHDSSTFGDTARREVNDTNIARVALLSQAAASAPKCPSRPLLGNVMNSDGSARSRISSWLPDALPWSWSDDGRIAMALDVRDLNSEIYTIAPDGSGMTRVTHDLARDGMPAFTPDGSRIAFTRGEPATTDLYLVDTDGSDLTQLTDEAGFEHSATWSPDGSRLAFVRGDGEVDGFGASGKLWVTGVDGSGLRMLSDQLVGYPAWSPDGTRIALELRDDEVVHLGVFDLETRTLTEFGEGNSPRWSPDGSRIAFVGHVDGAWDIYVMDAEGKDRVRLTSDDAFDTFPIWSPDGQEMIFLSAADD